MSEESPEEIPMEDTGRLAKGIKQLARRILFGGTANCGIEEELNTISQVDIAHLIMLTECGLINRERARRLINMIGELRSCNFKPLVGQVAPRGLYMLYESCLINELGADTGGILQTGRSRNDLNATVLRIRLREPYFRLARESLRLQAVLLRRGRRFAGVTMPAYTHYQAAVPITYGHYLAGVASELARDVESLLAVCGDLNRCPLGAGAVGGTTLPIDQARTASLLGFDEPMPNSIDAVASRDIVLRLLASATILGVTLSRVSADLLLWTTSEFGFLTLDDDLVGSSSMMPQKRNVFLLEHVKGRSAAALGAFVSSVTAMHGAPFSNSIAVGTEGVSPVWDALKKTTESCILARLVVAGAQPVRTAMLRAAADGYITATELANRLVVQGNMPFRTAHHTVGALIRNSIENGEDFESVLSGLKLAGQPVSLDALDPASVADSANYGGGPGPVSLKACLDGLQSTWKTQMSGIQNAVAGWREAEASLESASRALCANGYDNLADYKELENVR